MKKLLLLLFISILIMTGCSSKSNNVEDVNTIAGITESGKYDEFNKWLMNDLNLMYTPTFIVIDKNNKITYFNDGEVTAEQFKSILEDIKNNSVTLDEEAYKENIGKDFYNVDFVVKGKVNVIELVWTNCGHCKVQIDENNPEIFASNPDIVFTEYFPLDNAADVADFVSK